MWRAPPEVGLTGWDDLRHLLAVSRHGTLTRAAEALDVTRTTVGRRLDALEATIGVRLFDRTPDGLVPTPAGQDLVETAERVEEELLAAEGRLVGRDAELSGELRVSTLDYLLWAYTPLFRSFLERYPSIELTLQATLDEVSLPRREADVALRMTDTPPEGLIGRRVGEIGFAVYASEALVARVGDGAPYGAFPWVGLDGEPMRRWLDQWLAENAPGARIALRIDEGAILRRQAVCEGLGAHFMPTFEADALPGLRRLGPVHFTRDLWLLTLPQLRHTARVRAFLRHMADGIRS